MVDATTQAALNAQVVNWRVLIYADFVGDVLRGTTGLYDKTISGSGDAELDGTYEAYDHRLVNVGSVQHNENGSNTVSISISGLIVNDEAFLNLIGTKSNWQGRTARLWFYCVNESETQVGSIIPYYTGYMNDVTISGSPFSQVVTLTIENYLVSLSGAPNKTYLMQEQYDSGDLSAAAAIASANGTNGAGLFSVDVTQENYRMQSGGYS